MIHKLIDRIMARQDLQRDYKFTFETAHGQRVLKHILEAGGVTRLKFTTDPQQLLWNEAQRHFALSIFRQVHGSLDKTAEEIAEQIEKSEQINP